MPEEQTAAPSADQRQIIYEDADIRVIWHPGQTDYVMISFGDLNTLADGLRFFADGPADKADIATIGIVAKSGNWYPASALAAASDVINRHAASFPSRILYGSSMGGYGAIKFSKLLSATEVISLCPQWSLDISECNGFDPDWQDYFNDRMTNMGIHQQDTAGRIFMFFDPYDKIDAFHATMIRANSDHVTALKVPRVAHHLMAVFAGTNNLLEFIDLCRTGNLNALIAMSASLRRQSPIRREHVLKKLLARGAGLEKDLDEDFGAVFRLIDDNIEHLGTAGLLETYRQYQALIGNPHQKLLVCAYIGTLTSIDMVIETHHETFLIYDLRDNTCYHRPLVSRPSEIPVQIELFKGNMHLFVTLGNVKLGLSVEDDNLHLSDDFEDKDASKYSFDIAPTAGGLFSISCAGRYLCADPAGGIYCDRESADAWESFSFAHIRK